MAKWITIILLSSIALFTISYFGISKTGGFEVGEKIENPNDLSISEEVEDFPEQKTFPEINVASLVKAGLSGSVDLEQSNQGQTNFLILGTPGKDWPAPHLTDSIMVGILEYEPVSVKLVSIPRDFAYRKQSGTFVKLNSIYANNLSQGKLAAFKAVAKAIEDITGLRIHYYVKIDLNVVTEVVHKLGGVNVRVPETIYDPQFPGPHYSYQTFKVKRGWRYLDAQQAAKFIRTRHTQYGDFIRMQRQKQLLAALWLKIENMGIFQQFTTALSLWQSLRKHIETNLTLEELRTLFGLAKKIGLDRVQSDQLDIRGDNALLTETHMNFGQTQVYVVVPRAGAGDYSEIHEFFKEL